MPKTIPAVCFLLMTLVPAAQAGGAKTYRKFCTEIDFANKIFAEGVGGDKKLKECLFAQSKSVKKCVTALGVGRGIIKYIRRNSKYFRISGDALSGFVLKVNDRRLEEVGTNNPYAKLIRLRLRIQELVHHMGSHKKTEGSQDATPANLVKAQTRYVDLLDQQLEKERDKRIQDCLMRELDRYSKLVNRTDQ